LREHLAKDGKLSYIDYSDHVRSYRIQIALGLYFDKPSNGLVGEASVFE